MSLKLIIYGDILEHSELHQGELSFFLLIQRGEKSRKRNLFSDVQHTRSVSQDQGCWTGLQSVVTVGNVQPWPSLSSGNSIMLARLKGRALSRTPLTEAAIVLPRLVMKKDVVRAAA